MHSLTKKSFIFIGGSAGSFQTIKSLLNKLPKNWKIPLLIVIHLKRGICSTAEVLQDKTLIKVKEVEDKENIETGTAYIAPPEYHVAVESDHSFSLLVDEPLNFSCPSIDVCLESAVREYKDKLQIIMLSGANEDGLQSAIYAKKEKSGIWVQDPETCEYPEMTSCLVRAALAERILKVDQIIDQVLKLGLY